MAEAFSLRFDTREMEAALDAIADGAAAQIRPAAQAGAQVLYDEVLTRVPVSARGHWFHGTSFRSTGKKYWFDAGALRRSIYQVYSKDRSSADYATYHVSWNAAKAPYAFMVEYGTARAAARPFLRPAFDARVRDALEVARNRYVDGMRPLIAGMQ